MIAAHVALSYRIGSVKEIPTGLDTFQLVAFSGHKLRNFRKREENRGRATIFCLRVKIEWSRVLYNRCMVARGVKNRAVHNGYISKFTLCFSCNGAKRGWRVPQTRIHLYTIFMLYEFKTRLEYFCTKIITVMLFMQF